VFENFAAEELVFVKKAMNVFHPCKSARYLQRLLYKNNSLLQELMCVSEVFATLNR
jgi:hypothetical protein